ncbi:hypothetical protein GCM10027451_03030 [Geodermatophilus aquaeductus]
MRRALPAVLGAAISVSVLVACSTTVHGSASTLEVPRVSSDGEESPFAGGAQPTCLADDGCPDETTTPVGLICAPLPDAMAAFDARARAAFPSGEASTSGSAASLSALTDAVIDVVDSCGFQVMVDVANQYPEPLYTWLLATAASSLGEIGALPGGLRCADLAGLGLTPKNAVDYWFFWGSPGLMDADVDGIPCETVWADVAQYMPSYY